MRDIIIIFAFSLAMSLVIVLFFGCSNYDTENPSVSIVYPEYLQEIYGIDTIRVDASDNDQISKVEFMLDSVLVGSDTISPYECVVDFSNFEPGTHSITAKAYDRAGNWSVSDTINIIIISVFTFEGSVSCHIDFGGIKLRVLTEWTMTDYSTDETSSESYNDTINDRGALDIDGELNNFVLTAYDSSEDYSTTLRIKFNPETHNAETLYYKKFNSSDSPYSAASFRHELKFINVPSISDTIWQLELIGAETCTHLIDVVYDDDHWSFDGYYEYLSSTTLLGYFCDEDAYFTITITPNTLNKKSFFEGEGVRG